MSHKMPVVLGKSAWYASQGKTMDDKIAEMDEAMKQ